MQPVTNGYACIIDLGDGVVRYINEEWPPWGDSVKLRFKLADGQRGQYPIIIETRVDPKAEVTILSDEPADESERTYLIGFVRMMLDSITPDKPI